MSQVRSAGFQFLQAAYDGAPKTIGERKFVSLMTSALLLAIKNKFQFGREEGLELAQRFGFRCQYGVFRPLDFYSTGCVAGGTYCAMVEKAGKFKPWIANFVVAPYRDRSCAGVEVLERNRVGVGLHVLLPNDFSFKSAVNDPSLWHYGLDQVWCCTSISDTHIVLCRYEASEDLVKHYGPRQAPFVNAGGNPVRKLKLTRDEWAEIMSQKKGVSDVA